MVTDLADDVRSDSLFARPSFLEGIARIVDVSGSLNTYNVATSGDEADARAIESDWKAIGHDVKVALDQIADEATE